MSDERLLRPPRPRPSGRPSLLDDVALHGGPEARVAFVVGLGTQSSGHSSCVSHRDRLGPDMLLARHDAAPAVDHDRS